mgnify:CR=1 FL=1
MTINTMQPAFYSTLTPLKPTRQTSGNLDTNNSNSRFEMLVASEPLRSVQKTADGGTLVEWFNPALIGKGSAYLTSLIDSNSSVSNTPSRSEFEKAVKNISALIKEIKNFIRQEQGESQLNFDLNAMQKGDFESEIYTNMQAYSGEDYANLWIGVKMFFDYVSGKISGLPQDEINANIATIQSYLVSTNATNNKIKLNQDTLNLRFDTQNFKTNSNDSLLKALLNSASNDENLLKDLKV